MEKGISQIVIETMVRNALRDIKEDPERSTRNLVDMALHFSKGRFQKRFLEIVQKMLENENSAYYALVWDVVTNVDNEKLINFGMNLGYNSCTSGAKRIREWECENGYHVPWVISFKVGKDMDGYRKLMSEGEQMGIFTWLLFVEEEIEEVLPVIGEYPDCAILLFCNAGIVTEEVIDGLLMLRNTMLVVEYDENAEHICKRLREEKLLYGVSYCYASEDVQSIENGDLFYDIQALHPAAAILIPKRNCPDEVQKQIYQMVLDTRISQQYATLALELQGDVCMVDEIISGDAGFVYFDAEGNLYDRNQDMPKIEQVLSGYSLQEIVRECFEKKNAPLL